MGGNNASLVSTELIDPRIRIPLVASLTMLVCLAILVIFGYLLNQSALPESPVSPVDVQLVEMPVDGLAGGGNGSPAAPAMKPAHRAAIRKTTTVPAHLTALAPRKTIRQPQPHKPKIVDSDQVSIHHVNPVNEPARNSDVVSEKETATSSASPPAFRAGGKTGASKDGVGNGGGTGSGRGVGSGSGSGTDGGFGTGGSGPRAIYAPVPSILDDLRDEVMQATAVVRFHVTSDGKASVALISSTDYSELDELILDTLRQWRFAPAVRNGVKIDSDAELRLLVSVQ